LQQLPKAIRMKKDIFIGCSSFYNTYWKTIFYPEGIPRTKWFEYYCTHFNTYEMNGTFYRFPTLKFMEDWYQKAPEGFLFSVKAPKEITHIRKMTDCQKLIDDFYAICREGLKDKLGCILFQLPPSYQYSHEKLLQIISQLDISFSNVVEFRHNSWWIPEVWDGLSKNNITFCSVSHPQLPDTVFVESPLAYVRFHGKTSMFYSSYSPEELADVKEKISKSVKVKAAFIYFNNTAGPAGILNALSMKIIA
jgi:uncharacterized protein YecE (DUF72 family)